MTPTTRAGRPLTDAELRRRAVEPAKDHPWRPVKLPTTPGGGTSIFRRDSALVERLNRGPFPQPSEVEMGIQWKLGPKG